MPDYTQSISDIVWGVLEADGDVVLTYRPGNRDKPPTEKGYLRQSMAKAPADFPRIEVRIARGTHSGFSGVPAGVSPTFSSEAAAITAGTGPEFEVYRTVRVVLTMYHPLTNVPGANPYVENVIAALMNAGPRLGYSSLITGWGPLDYETRPMRRNEIGKREAGTAEVTTLGLPIRTRQVGKSLIA